MTRSKMYALTGIAALLYLVLCWTFADGLFALDNLWISDSISDSTIFSYLFLAIILGVGAYQATKIPAEGIETRSTVDTAAGQVSDPAFWRLLTANTYWAILWLPIRFFVGQEWLAAGEHKLRDSAWMDGGAALVAPGEAVGYWERVVVIPEQGRPAITYGWFRDFIQYMIDNEWASWFAKLIAIGEFMVGLGLVVGCLVGIAAFFGAVMNFNFMLAGSASTNPVLFAFCVLVIMGWKVAGYFGVDRVLLPMLGTPWKVGRLFDHSLPSSPPQRQEVFPV